MNRTSWIGSKVELRSLAFNRSFRFLYQQGTGGGASLKVKAGHFSYFEGRRTDKPYVFSIDTAQKGGSSSSRIWSSRFGKPMDVITS